MEYAVRIARIALGDSGLFDNEVVKRGNVADYLYQLLRHRVQQKGKR